ncbi:MAG: hypothetical protein JO067_11065 [Cupriavidus sp.]|nr:hypothetical protein [Cupriavidus sp.]
MQQLHITAPEATHAAMARIIGTLVHYGFRVYQKEWKTLRAGGMRWKFLVSYCCTDDSTDALREVQNVLPDCSPIRVTPVCV